MDSQNPNLYRNLVQQYVNAYNNLITHSTMEVNRSRRILWNDQYNVGLEKASLEKIQRKLEKWVEEAGKTSAQKAALRKIMALSANQPQQPPPLLMELQPTLISMKTFGFETKSRKRHSQGPEELSIKRIERSVSEGTVSGGHIIVQSASSSCSAVQGSSTDSVDQGDPFSSLLSLKQSLITQLSNRNYLPGIVGEGVQVNFSSVGVNDNPSEASEDDESEGDDASDNQAVLPETEHPISYVEVTEENPSDPQNLGDLIQESLQLAGLSPGDLENDLIQPGNAVQCNAAANENSHELGNLYSAAVEENIQAGTPIYPESVPDEYLLRLIENADEGEKQQECVPCTINAGNLHHVSTLESNQGLANEPPINLSQAMGCATNNDHNGEETGNNELLTDNQMLADCYKDIDDILDELTCQGHSPQGIVDAALGSLFDPPYQLT